MDRIFAPWRIDWITKSDADSEFEECVFCELPQLDEDAERRILARSDWSYALLNHAPYNPGHSLVVPLTHVDTILDIDEAILFDVVLLLRRTVEAIDTALNPDGFNIGANIGSAAGASIKDHLHLHVIPRWGGDTTFLPTSSNTKVIVEALDVTYERLRESFQSLDGVERSDQSGSVRINGAETVL